MNFVDISLPSIKQRYLALLIDFIYINFIIASLAELIHPLTQDRRGSFVMRSCELPSTTLPKHLYINRKRVIELTGISRSTIDRLEEAGKFPKRVALTTRRVAWRATEIIEWAEERSRNS
jgi:prophage regulatory protein